MEEEKNRLIFEEMPVPKALMTMALPSIISQIIILIYNMADTFFIGHTNNPLMVAGAALILPIFNICIAVSNIAGTGGGTLISRLLGIHRNDQAQTVAKFSFYFSIAGGLLFAAMTGIFITPLLRLLGASSDTFEYARKYAICVIVIGAVPTILSSTLANLLRNVGCSKKAGLGISMGGILNIILDPLFMFVILPEGNEIVGAGIATAISNYVTCAYFLIVIRSLESSVLNFRPVNIIPSSAHLKSFFLVGVGSALGPFLFDIDYMVLDRLMSAHGDVALAAIGIVLKVERLPTNIGVGVGLGMVPLLAYNYSSGDHERMFRVFKTGILSAVAIELSAIALYQLFTPYIVRFFIDDAATVALGTKFLKVRSIATVVMFLSFVYVYFFNAVGKGQYSMLLVVFRWLLVNIPMLFILDRFFGTLGLAWAQFISDFIVASSSTAIYLSYKRKNFSSPGR